MLNILLHVNNLLLLLHVNSFIYFLKHKLRHYYYFTIINKLVDSLTPPAVDVVVDHLSVWAQGNTVLPSRMKSKQSSTFELDCSEVVMETDIPAEVNRKWSKYWLLTQSEFLMFINGSKMIYSFIINKVLFSFFSLFVNMTIRVWLYMKHLNIKFLFVYLCFFSHLKRQRTEFCWKGQKQLINNIYDYDKIILLI